MLYETLQTNAQSLTGWFDHLKPRAHIVTLSQPGEASLPSWFDLSMLEACLRRADQFLGCYAPQYVYDAANIPTVFLQQGNSQTDSRAARRLVQDTPRLIGEDIALPYIRLFHTHILWNSVGITYDGKIVRGHLRSRGHFNGMHNPRLPGQLLGYRLVDGLPKHVGVSAHTLSLTMCRMIMHDILHAALPLIDNHLEPYHDVLTLYAMWGWPEDRPDKHDWDWVVAQEATNPLFCRDTRVLWEIEPESLPLHGAAMLRKFREWHAYGGNYHDLFPDVAKVPDNETVRQLLQTWMEEQAAAGFPAWTYSL